MHKLSWNVGEGCVNERRLYAPRNSGGVILLGACRPPTRYLQAGTGIADTTGERPAQRTSSGRRGMSSASGLRAAPSLDVILGIFHSQGASVNSLLAAMALLVNGVRREKAQVRIRSTATTIPKVPGVVRLFTDASWQGIQKAAALSLRLKMQMRYLSARSRFCVGESDCSSELFEAVATQSEEAQAANLAHSASKPNARQMVADFSETLKC